MKNLLWIFFALVAACIALALLDVATHPQHPEPLKGHDFERAQEQFDRSQKEQAQYANVSLVALLANPAVYDKKRVRVSGYACLEFEHLALYLDKNAFDSGLQQNGVWLQMSPWIDGPTRKRFTRRYVQIEATFNAREKGYGSYNGTLENLRSLRRISSNADFYAAQAGWQRDAIVLALREVLWRAAALVLLAIIVLGLLKIIRRRPA